MLGEISGLDASRHRSFITYTSVTQAVVKDMGEDIARALCESECRTNAASYKFEQPLFSWFKCVGKQIVYGVFLTCKDKQPHYHLVMLVEDARIVR